MKELSLGQINIALVSENPIEVYKKDEYDKMIEIDRLLDEKGVELWRQTGVYPDSISITRLINN